jgi:hypothetical protein
MDHGGQGPNRTIDTQTFNPTESPVRRAQAEDREESSAWPTEPPHATEPFPSRAAGGCTLACKYDVGADAGLDLDFLKHFERTL